MQDCMSKGQPNSSWREQRKPVQMRDLETGTEMEFVSLWEAAHMVACAMLCKPETAKKEIKRAIKTGAQRYGAKWSWRN